MSNDWSLNTMLKKGAGATLRVLWSICGCLEITKECVFSETRWSNNHCLQMSLPRRGGAEVSYQGLDDLLVELILLFVDSTSCSCYTLLLGYPLLNLGFKFWGSSTHQKQMSDAFLHQYRTNMSLLCQVRRIIQFFDMHRVKHRLHQCKCAGCLNFERLELSQFEILILRRILPRDSDNIRFRIEVETLKQKWLGKDLPRHEWRNRTSF